MWDLSLRQRRIKELGYRKEIHLISLPPLASILYSQTQISLLAKYHPIPLDILSIQRTQRVRGLLNYLKIHKRQRISLSSLIRDRVLSTRVRYISKGRIRKKH